MGWNQVPLLTKGDTVVVIKGDLTDLMGKVLRVRQVRQPIACTVHMCFVSIVRILAELCQNGINSRKSWYQF